MMGLAAVAHTGLAEVSGWSQAATGSLVAAVWQGILLAVVAGLGLRLLPKTPAAVRFAIWFGVFLVVTMLPVVSLLPHASAVGPISAHSAWLILDERWCLAIAVVWALASLVRAATLTAAAFRVRALWKRATPVVLASSSEPRPTLCKEGDGAPELLSAAPRRAQICVSDEVDRPTVIGFFSPKILIPGWLLEKLTPAELEQIVLHEAGHLGRADDWMNLVQKLALVVFPLNPALAWVERRLCFERELAVDERVLHAFAGRAGAAKAYAECLTTLAEYRLQRRELPLGLGLVLGALGRESELGRRIGRILRRGERMRPLHARLVLAGAMLGLLVAATGFERCPQVIGFSAGSAPAVASESQWQPLRGEETGVNRAPIRGRDVVYRAHVHNRIQPVAQAAHETLAVALEPKTRKLAFTETMAKEQRGVAHAPANPVRMVQTVAPVSQHGPTSVSEKAPAQPANLLMQWVVVTTWQDGNGTRMVMTTASLPPVAGSAVPMQQAQAAGRQPAAAQQVYPAYAAVPVRGGWLVFQL